VFPRQPCSQRLENRQTPYPGIKHADGVRRMRRTG
jgi:hypothetical protein